MSLYSLHHVDSFTTTLFGGNPTACVFDAHRLTDEKMKQIAREMNLSETSFFLPSDKADFRLRYFTPSEDEIKFCGHATVGALCALAKEGRYGTKAGEKTALRVETNVGVLSMEVDLTNPKLPVYSFDAPKIDLVPAPYRLEDVLDALGIPHELVDFKYPLMLEKTNNSLYFTVPSLEALGKININVSKAVEFAKKDRIILFCALTPHAFDSTHHAHVRAFAPLVGIPEDPFTGAIQGGLAAYLIHNNLVDTTTNEMVFEQGHFLKRPGSVKIEIQRQPHIHARLHAYAKHVFATTLNLED